MGDATFVGSLTLYGGKSVKLIDMRGRTPYDWLSLSSGGINFGLFLDPEAMEALYKALDHMRPVHRHPVTTSEEE